MFSESHTTINNVRVLQYYHINTSHAVSANVSRARRTNNQSRAVHFLDV